MIYNLSANDIYKIISNGKLNIRSTPSVNSKIIGTIDSGTLIEVSEVTDSWATIMYKGNKSYISSRYIELVTHIEDKENILDFSTDSVENTSNIQTNEEKLSHDTLLTTNKDKQFEKKIINKNYFWETWGLDVIPSIGIGVTGFYGYKPSIGTNIGCVTQLYQKRNEINYGYVAEAGIGYSLKGGRSFPVQYFVLILNPIGYYYTYKDVKINAIMGMSFNIGGGHLHSYYTGYTYEALPINFDFTLNILAEYHNIGVGVSFEQSMIRTYPSNNPNLHNYCANLNIRYRLFDIKNKSIYKF